MSTQERRLREKEERRKAILVSAERIFCQKGFTESSMEEIAEAVELSKGTLYLYFKTKEELAFAIFHKNLLALKEMISRASREARSGIEKIRAILSAYYRFYREHLYVEGRTAGEAGSQPYFNRLLGYYFQGDHPHNPYAEQCYKEIESIMGIIVAALQEGMKDGTIRADIDPAKTAMTYGNLVLLFMLHLSRGNPLVLKGHGYSAEELFDYMFDLFLHSLVKEK